MDNWIPASREWVQRHFEQEAATLHPAHYERLLSMRVPMRQIPVRACPDEFVWVVGEYEGKVLYWSDVEEGWELGQADAGGGVEERGANQLDLAYLMRQIFGDPA